MDYPPARLAADCPRHGGGAVRIRAADGALAVGAQPVPADRLVLQPRALHGLSGSVAAPLSARVDEARAGIRPVATAGGHDGSRTHPLSAARRHEPGGLGGGNRGGGLRAVDASPQAHPTRHEAVPPAGGGLSGGGRTGAGRGCGGGLPDEEGLSGRKAADVEGGGTGRMPPAVDGVRVAPGSGGLRRRAGGLLRRRTRDACRGTGGGLAGVCLQRESRGATPHTAARGFSVPPAERRSATSGSPLPRDAG